MSEAPSPRAPHPGLAVDVVTPEGSAYSGPATSVVVPAHDGEVAFFPQHAPFVAAVGLGELRVRTPAGETLRWYLEGGVVQVVDDQVAVLAEHVLPAAEVDAAEAEAALREALAAVPTTEEAFAARDRLSDSARARLSIARRPPAP